MSRKAQLYIRCENRLIRGGFALLHALYNNPRFCYAKYVLFREILVTSFHRHVLLFPDHRLFVPSFASKQASGQRRTTILEESSIGRSPRNSPRHPASSSAREREEREARRKRERRNSAFGAPTKSRDGDIYEYIRCEENRIASRQIARREGRFE